MMLRPALLLTAASLALSACATAPAADEALRLEVSKTCAARSQCHETLGEALAAAAAEPESRQVRIAIGPGEFEERVVAERSNLVITGAGKDRTRLHHDLVAENASRLHRDGWGTAGSVVTVELASALRTPTDADMLKMWRDLRNWMDQTQLASRSPGLEVLQNTK